jgi:hypothetical protein
MSNGGNDLTTNEAAKICGVTAAAIAYWVDRGFLKGYRAPGSWEIRVRPAGLARFMKEYHIRARQALSKELEPGAETGKV